MTALLYIAGGRRPGSRATIRYHCGICGEWVGRGEREVEIGGQPSRATYHNPQGIACEIVTLAGCESFRAADHSTIEHTWFRGYAWTPIGCGGCRVHLGWRFDRATAGPPPPVFFGLLVDRLDVEHPDSSPPPTARGETT